MGTGVQGEPAGRWPALGSSSRLPKGEKQSAYQESPPGPPGSHGAQPHLRRCSISACFSRSSLKAEARLSSSCSASVAVPVPAGCANARPGRALLKEGIFLLELHKVLAKYLTKPCDEHTPGRCGRKHTT